METAINTGLKPNNLERFGVSKSNMHLVQILTSSASKEGKINFSARPAQETSPGNYELVGETLRFLVDRKKLFGYGKEDAWRLLPGSVLTVERDAEGKLVALYSPLSRYSERSKRAVESTEPFYLFP